jgi:Ca2+/Na+ antiporter
MESIINALISNKLLLAVAVIVSILIILSALKKLVKIAVVLFAMLILYIGYLVYTGQNVPKTKDEIIEYGEKKIDTIKKDGFRSIRKDKK